MSDSEPPTMTRYRLRADIEGTCQVFLLREGENSMGSAANNDVVLKTRGISRRHAVFHVTPEALKLEDLRSKNGTFVHGDAIATCQVAVGDQIALGPVTLDLETVDSDDAEVGMVLGPMRATAADESTARLGDTTYLSRAAMGQQNLFRLIDEVLERLTVRPLADLEGALTRAVGWLGVEGASLLEWSAGASPTSLAAVGRVGEAPSHTALRAARKGRHDGDLRVVLGTSPGSTVCVALAQPGSHYLGLAFWGELPQGEALEPCLGTLLRLVIHFRPREVHPGPSRGGEESLQLRFPNHIVRGESPAMVQLYQQMEQLLQGKIPVLICGETGVGNEHLARLLHDSSPRRSGPFIAVNCAAIPTELLEAEMFGIGRGVATGVNRRRGKFLEATGGTLFLDEIGDMAAPLQAKLLRVLQEQEVQPLGEQPVVVDVRVLAATNSDLHRRMAAGEFRRDLYYRLAGYVLEPPPLCRRGEDLPRLVGHFVRKMGEETGRSVHGLTVKALRALSAYSWPGNVRELEHEVRRLVFQCPGGGVIDSGMLSPHILQALLESDLDSEAAPDPDDLALAPHLEAVERRLLQRALVRTGGNQSRAARFLGISRNGLAKRLDRLGIDPADLAP